MKYIVDIYPNKAQFVKQNAIDISVELINPFQEDKRFILRAIVFKLIEQVEQVNVNVTLLSGEYKTVTVVLSPQNVEWEGYGVDLSLYEKDNFIEQAQTAFDVVSDWCKAPRYGFLSDFYPKDQGDLEDIKSLCKFHFNLVQFYDWMYRHDELIPPESEFTDLMGRRLSYDVVTDKIRACHEHGMKAIAYGAVYAASNEFYQNHQEWALYNSSGEVYSFIDIFKIMNISPDSPWRAHIIDQYRKAIEKANFDGIHMDTYGFPKSGISRINGIEKAEYLEENFPDLINQTRKELEKVKNDICLIFNNVGNWPVDTVAKSLQDALYIEVWDPYDRYHHLIQIIEQAKLLSRGKPILLAAYLIPFAEKGIEKTQESQFSALILTAVLAANGSYHMLLGENKGILTQGYYANYVQLGESFTRKMRDYYDFIVRYSSILFDRNMRCVSKTHTKGDNQEYVFANLDISTYGEPGKVWVNIYEKPQRKTISFINLCGNESDIWNQGKKEPLVVCNILVKIEVLRVPKVVYMASPDSLISAVILDYKLTESPRGKVVELVIPELEIWTLVVLEF